MPTKQYKGSIRKKLVLTMLFVTLLVVSFVYTLFAFWNIKTEYKNDIKLSKSIGHVLSQNFAKLIFLNDIKVATDITTALKSFENIEFMILYKNNKTVIYQYSKNNKVFIPSKLPDFKEISVQKEKNLLKIFREAKYEHQKVGYVELGIATKSFFDLLKRDFLVVIITYILTIIFSFLLASYFAKIFTTPVLKLYLFQK